jgi:hypothetical protein
MSRFPTDGAPVLMLLLSPGSNAFLARAHFP